MEVNRKAQVLRQSPGLSSKTDRPGPSYEAQLNAVINKKLEPEVYRALASQEGDHAHHKVLLETIDKLFIGLNESEQAELRNYIGSKHGISIGNSLRNLINIPGEIHQGRKGQDSIHQFARNQGFEIDSKKIQIGLARDVLEASTVPSLEYRKHVADNYLTKALPSMNNKINDLLTDYYKGATRMAASPDTRKVLIQGLQEAALREKALNDNYQIDGSDRSDSPGSNRDRSLVVDSGGGDVNIGADFMGRRGKGKNGKNGNGDGDGNGNGMY